MSWTGADDEGGFGLSHLPYGAVRLPGQHTTTLAVRIGDLVLDAGAAARAGLLPTACDAPNLDRLLAARPTVWAATRAAVAAVLGDGAHRPAVEPLLHPVADVEPALPFTVGDYVDFYSSEPHATNVGRLFRPDDDPLLPNWRHLPVGYHGRSGTVVVDGTPVRRPSGQRPGDDAGPTFGPSRRLDVELELAWVVGGATTLGEPVPIDAVEDHVFGVALFDDWSARDPQAWEYRPLGPFLGKSFASSIAAWVTPLDALQDAKVPGPAQLDPLPLPYLQTVDHWNLAIDLELRLSTAAMRAAGLGDVVVSRSSTTHLYWTIAQQLAHLTVNGASIRPGDLCATGTISGPARGQEGSLLELTLAGERPLALPTGESRTFLEDGDEVTLRGVTADGRIRLGDVTGRVLPGTTT